jgi:hypothetical protein
VTRKLSAPAIPPSAAANRLPSSVAPAYGWEMILVCACSASHHHSHAVRRRHEGTPHLDTGHWSNGPPAVQAGPAACSRGPAPLHFADQRPGAFHDVKAMQCAKRAALCFIAEQEKQQCTDRHVNSGLLRCAGCRATILPASAATPPRHTTGTCGNQTRSIVSPFATACQAAPGGQGLVPPRSSHIANLRLYQNTGKQRKTRVAHSRRSQAAVLVDRRSCGSAKSRNFVGTHRSVGTPSCAQSYGLCA